MDLGFLNLPLEINWKISLYLSHPCADMIRDVSNKMKSFGWGDDFSTNFFLHYIKYGHNFMYYFMFDSLIRMSDEEERYVANLMRSRFGLPHLFTDFS